MLKELALRAGLNCGAWVNKRDQSCKDTACCKRRIRRFHKTFATSRYRDGASLLDLKKWLGHSALKSTELYLAECDLESPEVRWTRSGSSSGLGRATAKLFAAKEWKGHRLHAKCR
jgi:hypothetical protein